MAGRPVEALALLAIGVRTLSMSPGAIGPVKAMIRSLDLNEVTGFMNAALSQPDRPMRETSSPRLLPIMRSKFDDKDSNCQ